MASETWARSFLECSSCVAAAISAAASASSDASFAFALDDSSEAALARASSFSRRRDISSAFMINSASIVDPCSDRKLERASRKLPILRKPAASRWEAKASWKLAFDSSLAEAKAALSSSARAADSSSSLGGLAGTDPAGAPVSDSMLRTIANGSVSLAASFVSAHSPRHASLAAVRAACILSWLRASRASSSSFFTASRRPSIVRHLSATDCNAEELAAAADSKPACSISALVGTGGVTTTSTGGAVSTTGSGGLESAVGAAAEAAASLAGATGAAVSTAGASLGVVVDFSEAGAASFSFFCFFDLAGAPAAALPESGFAADGVIPAEFGWSDQL
mmetsp:Transcript_11030/g.20006  ORF Transcript_11030/g.20006 Transcript_11030/m.20006 type:complete len:336 (+) Transcript_11030:720-1727(+)